MWNENDITAAHEHIEDLRRAAEKHNAVVRMKTGSQAAGQATKPDGQAGNIQPGSKQPGSKQPGSKQPDKQQQNLWERVRNSLR